MVWKALREMRDAMPERFLDGHNYGHAYFPFGIGGRLCLGEPFAMRQMALILSTFVAQAALEFAPGYEARPVRNLALIVPRHGTLVVNRAISPAKVMTASPANVMLGGHARGLQR